MSQREPMYLSERQNNWALEKQSCDTERNTCMREVFQFQTFSNERFPCRVPENKLSTKTCSPENEDQSAIEDDTLLNVHGQPLETETLSVWSPANMCENLQLLNPPQVQQNKNIEQNNKRNGGKELRKNSSATPLNKDLFQMDLLSHKSISDKKWKHHKLLQVPFLCGNSSVFSPMEQEKNNFLEKKSSTEDKDYSSCGNKTTAQRYNKENNNSSYTIPTLKPFKSIQPLEIPNFLLLSISNKINSKMPSTNLKEVDWKNFKGQLSLMQCKQLHGVKKMSEVRQQKLQNDESSVKASTVGSEFKEKNYPSIRKQEHSGLAEGGKVSGTYFRGNSTDLKCNKIFVENYFQGKMLENSDDDEDEQKSKLHIYLSSKNVQNEQCVSCNDLLWRIGRKSSNESSGTFHIQTSIPVIAEPLEKNKLVVQCGVRNCNRDISLYKAEPKLSTKVILALKRFLIKNITFQSNCPRMTVQKFPDKKMICSIFRGKEMVKLKFSFRDTLYGWVKPRTESLYKDMPTCQEDNATHWFHFCETLNEQCNAHELVKNNINRSHNNKICICLLAVISEHLKVELLKTILLSFFNNTDTLQPTEGRTMRVQKSPLCGRKQDQLNSPADNTLRQNTEFYKKKEIYPGLVNSKFKSLGFELHNEYQRRHFHRALEEKKSTLLRRGILLHKQNNRLCKERHVRRHNLLIRGSKGFNNYLRSASHKNSTKKQILVAKCLILLQGTSDCSSLDKMYCRNIIKIQYLIGANLRFWSCFSVNSQLKFEKVSSKCTNQEISVTTVKQKKKLSNIFHGSFHGERFKAFPFVLRENKKHEPTGCRNCVTATDGVTNEVSYAMKNYLGTSGSINDDQKECVKSKELEINSHNFISKKSFSIFDTYEKIPLTTDTEDFDQILIVNQDNSIKKKLAEEVVVTTSEEVHNLHAKSNDELILPEHSKTTMEKCNCLLLQDSQTNKPEYCKKIDTNSPYLTNEKEKLEDKNTYSNFENSFPSSLNVFQSVSFPLDRSSFDSTEKVVSGDGHCRSSSSTNKQKESEKIRAAVQYPSTGSPAVTDACLQSQAEETVQLSLQEHTQTNKAVSLEPAILKQHLEYVEEQEDISDEQMHITNESHCGTVMNYLIMSEDESKTFIAAEEKLKMPSYVMNNQCIEDVKDKYLALESKITYEFELKRKFALVLEELRMFHEISKGNENNLSSLETNSQNDCELSNSEGVDENVTSVSPKKVGISSPICSTIEGQNITDSNKSSLNQKMSSESEDHKVSKEYSLSRPSREELHSPFAEGYFDAAYKKPYTWNPAFLSSTLLNEQNYNLQEVGGYFLPRDVIRVQPLKTCKGPIRIGLSRKARPKQLHPYLK